MERLQQAIEKARNQREQPTAPAASPVRQHPMRPKPANSGVPQTEAWEALEAIHLRPKLLHRRRIFTLEGGLDSAPFDLLRTRMLQQARYHGWKRIAVVSPHKSCGKSTVTANLAFSLSRQPNLRSIIFDFDLRRGGLTAILGQRPPLGMAEVLERQALFSDQARRYNHNLVFGLNTGTRVANSSEILQSSQTTEVLDEITAQYAPDIMLFDMPPLLASDDNFGFLQNVDAALIMVAAEKTPMSQIDVAERHVAELTNVMGIVLNQCRYTGGAHGHEYDYY